MAEISRVALFGKLNSVAYRGVEAATVFCKMRGNPYVELVHWIHQILQLRADDHQQLAIRELDHFRLHRAAARLIDAVRALPPGLAAVVGEVANTSQVIAPLLEDVRARRNGANDPAL